MTTLEGSKVVEGILAKGNKSLFGRIKESGKTGFRPRITINEMAQICSEDIDLPEEEMMLAGECPLLIDKECSEKRIMYLFLGRLREELVPFSANHPNEKIIVDLVGVNTLSPSWGDEFLSLLLKKFGNRVEIKNAKNLSVAMTLSTLEELHGYTFKIL